MKIKSFWMLAVAGLMLSVTCNIKDYEEFPTDSTLSLPDNVITAVATGGNYSIDVTSNGTWAASVSAGIDWCALDNASGTGNGAIKVAVDENIALAPRNTTVTIAIKGSVIKQVAVKQASADTLLRIEPADLELTSVAGTYSAEVISNCPWTVAVNAEASAWCSVMPASGDGRVPISLVVTPNSGTQRAATVTVATVSGTLTAQLAVRQNMDAIGVSPTSITALVGANTYPVSVMTLEPATTWTAAVTPASATWCTLTPASGTGNGTMTVNVAENTSGASRAATVTVTSGETVKTVVVTQNEPLLTLDRTTISAMSPAASYTVNVTSDVNWTASVTPATATWCTVAPASGTNNGSFTVGLTRNATGAPRAATVTVTGNGLSRTIAVSQLEEGLGVMINGITWATRNLDVAGAFVATPGDKGKLYQWNNLTPHEYGSTSGWSTSIPTTDWQAANDPCPAGWRLPTTQEFNSSLTSGPSRWVVSSADNWNVAGMWVGPDAATATAASPGQAIFLPVTGYATVAFFGGTATSQNGDTHGYYWASNQVSLQNGWYLEFSTANPSVKEQTKRNGSAVRCVSQ